MSDDPLPALLRAREAAAILGCSLRTVRRMIKSGKLPVVTVSDKLVRIPRAALLELAHKATPRPSKRRIG